MAVPFAFFSYNTYKYLTHDDVDNILMRYDERRQKRKDAKRKEAQAQQLLKLIDTNGDGLLSLEEWAHAFHHCGLPESQVLSLIHI